jgi:O-acetyl-ADP-ribose deacetylase (regulator of RNase III)
MGLHVKKGELTRMYGDRIINAVNETLASGGVVRCAIQ